MVHCYITYLYTNTLMSTKPAATAYKRWQRERDRNMMLIYKQQSVIVGWHLMLRALFFRDDINSTHHHYCYTYCTHITHSSACKTIYLINACCVATIYDRWGMIKKNMVLPWCWPIDLILFFYLCHNVMCVGKEIRIDWLIDWLMIGSYHPTTSSLINNY